MTFTWVRSNNIIQSCSIVDDRCTIGASNNRPVYTSRVSGGDLISEILAAPVDLWVAQDKVEHFGCCAAVTVVAYLGALCHPRCARYRLPLSAICSVLVGVLKEAGDYLQWWPGLLSLKDLAADLTGTVFALTALAVNKMALVPFRVSGAAADQTLEHRLFQIGQHTLRIDQDVHKSGSLQRVGIQHSSDASSDTDKSDEQLDNVGLVVWQSAFVLAEYLLRHPPFGQWHDVHAVDLGAGTGVTGIALAMAGASTVLTDLPHITPLTQRNLECNVGAHHSHAKVICHRWGDDVASLLPAPDVITGADIVYQQEHFNALITTLQDLAAPHTLIYLAYKLRGRGEECFKQKLQDSSFVVQVVPCHQLHEEYCDGQYQIVLACKLGS